MMAGLPIYNGILVFFNGMECIFCKIVQHQIKANIVYDDDEIMAFRDINPQAPVHILVVPKKHISSLKEISQEDIPLIGRIYSIMNKLAKAESIEQCGFRIVVNDGPDAGQAVPHLHFHLLGGRKLSWPPG